MNSRISAGSTVVDGGGCQPLSPLQKVRKQTVKKKRQPNRTARLTVIEPYQRPGSGTPGQWRPIVNRDAIPALPAAGLLACSFMV